MISANIYDKASGKRYFDPTRCSEAGERPQSRRAGPDHGRHRPAGGSQQRPDPGVPRSDHGGGQARLRAEIRDSGGEPGLAITHAGVTTKMASTAATPGDVEMARTAGRHPGRHHRRSLPEPGLHGPGTPDKYADFRPGDDCLPDQQNGTWIMQAHEWGKVMSRAQFDYQNGKLTLTQVRSHPGQSQRRGGAFIQERSFKDPELYPTPCSHLSGKRSAGAGRGDRFHRRRAGRRACQRAQKQTNLGRLITTATAEAEHRFWHRQLRRGACLHRGWRHQLSRRADRASVFNTVNKATTSGGEAGGLSGPGGDQDHPAPAAIPSLVASTWRWTARPKA